MFPSFVAVFVVAQFDSDCFALPHPVKMNGFDLPQSPIQGNNFLVLNKPLSCEFSSRMQASIFSCLALNWKVRLCRRVCSCLIGVHFSSTGPYSAPYTLQCFLNFTVECILAGRGILNGNSWACFPFEANASTCINNLYLQCLYGLFTTDPPF